MKLFATFPEDKRDDIYLFTMLFLMASMFMMTGHADMAYDIIKITSGAVFMQMKGKT